MEIYCNQLGMVTDFSYCVSVNEGLPCRNIIGCFQGRADIIELLREKFTADELKKAFGGLPKSRIERIIESINSNT
jgi:hypothetical protein